MSTSFQSIPAPGQPTTQGTIYPTTPDNQDHSSGSFGMVFVVLSIILVVSAVACLLARICGKKTNESQEPNAYKKDRGKKTKRNNKHENGYGHENSHNKHMNHPSNSKSNHHDQKHGSGRARDPDFEFGYRSKEGDVMLGFDPKIKIPSAKVANHHGDQFRGNGNGNGNGKGPGMGIGMGPGMGMGMGPGMEQHGESRDYP